MDLNEKSRGWLLPAKKESTLKAGLYLIGTPIGNLGDITLRALDTLAGVDVLFCEDTRVSGKLLKAYDIKKPLRPYHDHSLEKDRDAIIALIEQGQRVGLISDAGLPLIADPGYKLVCACQQAGHFITALPGPSSTLTALQISGLPSHAFSFAGFIPAQSKARRDFLSKWGHSEATLIVFETAARLQKSLADFDALMPDRPLVIARELTKLYEETRSGRAGELLAYYQKHGAPKGEIVMLVGPAPAQEMSDTDIENALRRLLADHSVKEAAKIIAAQSGHKVSALYDLALKIKKGV